MSDDDDNISKLVILTLGIGAICFFAYLIFKEYRGYKLGSQQMSLADDNLFNLERKVHQLEMDRMNRGNVRTLQPVLQTTEQVQTTGIGGYEQNIDAPPVPRKVVSMNSTNKQSIVPNVRNLSKADQDKVRRMFFDMR